MEAVIIYIFRGVLSVIYFFLKLIPTNKRKIVYISRQANKMTIDFRMLKAEFNRRDKNIKQVFLCKRLKEDLWHSFLYFFTILRQMYHLATSKVAIIDSYCIPVCICHHKKSLFVLQIWHALGKIKKSGYQTLDAPSGREKKLAKLMCMHKNYDKIIVGSKIFDSAYMGAFNAKKEQLLHYGLPRIDYLLNFESKIKDKIYTKYPEFKGKKIVYYVPTFRTYKVDGPNEMVKKYNPKDFVLIIHNHPNQKLNIEDKKVYFCKDFKSAELLTIADYVITDYSSMCLEAAVLNKKVLFYVYDYDKYMQENGVNLDVKKALPSCTFKDIDEIFKIIKTDKYDIKAYQKFRKLYLPKLPSNSAKKIADYIMKKVM